MLIGNSTDPKIFDDAKKEESRIRKDDSHASGRRFYRNLVIYSDDDRPADKIIGVSDGKH